ncbi:precorrin-2 dehydrogenase/sirohydrochlorin ferrochelatase family protein [Alicyclobacillus dauci]|uniref:precorrin-2 dehydrogenase n=1 Tax=Alicyclobacillus dauci TaxID=1475485 RepID=A0ABY6Z6B5_9BACL|nr:bifunctional precorrin-2 dehydrogenase/sirohydrochlorin ferrochelatase [Alicyclobacillus dauci]WAH37814.1 bifunctional precorrin-2 dehydrogenase/sirohydrochlorin ferrochelatase [Alicyclobacillus dauci]
MYFAAFLNLQNKTCLVVGGGKVAERRIGKLVRAGAKVTVVSPDLTATLAEWAEQGVIVHRDRQYQAADLAGAQLVFAATNVREVNDRVTDDAKRQGVWVNVADNPDACDFIVPSVVEQPSVHIAISTLGASPSTTKALREALEADLADGGRRFYEQLEHLRGKGLGAGNE